MPAKILIVSDAPSIQALNVSGLEDEGHRVLSADGERSAMALIETSAPDVLIVARDLAVMSGTDFTRTLRFAEKTRALPILMFGPPGNVRDKLSALDAGADDYLTTPFSTSALRTRMKAVLRRRAPRMSEDCVDVNGLRVNPVQHRAYCGERGLALGATLFRLLHFLMTHQDRIFSRRDLLDQVWGGHAFASERTVDVQVRRLRSALEATGHDRLIKSIRGAGYCFSARPKAQIAR